MALTAVVVTWAAGMGGGGLSITALPPLGTCRSAHITICLALSLFCFLRSGQNDRLDGLHIGTSNVVKKGLTQRSLTRAPKECNLPRWFIARFLRRCYDSHKFLSGSVCILSSLPLRNENKKHGNCFMPVRPCQTPFSRFPAIVR